MRIESETIRIDWFENTGFFSDWNVKREDVKISENWFSLVSRGKNMLAVSYHLAIADHTLKSSIWRKRNNRCAVSESRHFNDSLLVQRCLCVNNQPYRLALEITLKNISEHAIPDSDLAILLGPGLGEYPIEGLGIAENLYSYVTPVCLINNNIISTEPKNGKFSRIRLIDTDWQWVGLQSRYYAMILAPLQPHSCNAVEYQWKKLPDNNHLPPRYLTEAKLFINTAGLEPGMTRQFNFAMFAGPKSISALGGGDDQDFQRLLFSNQSRWMRILCIGLLWILSTIQNIIGNWGLSILALALIVRVMIYPLARKMMADQKKFATVQAIINPEIREIKKKYTGETQSEQILSLYKNHGISPFTGMKPLVIVMIQLPIFIALFHVLGQAVALQNASFLWIKSLGLPDQLFSFKNALPFFGAHFNLLPFLMAVSTLATIKLSPMPGQNNVFLSLMAFGFLILFYPFPSGMVLYWTAANFLQILQQILVNKKPGPQNLINLNKETKK